ncbi:MAG: hypothetical protein ACYDIB_12920 [Desulfobulbia bacterium]
MMAQEPWVKYAVCEPSKKKNWTAPSCQPFETVSHVSHVQQALHICEDREIRAGLVYDESILCEDRITVVWLSPNTWVKGSRYGNIQFDYDWKLLSKNRIAYWVENIDYHPTACRFLLTERRLKKDISKKLILYDPTEGNGPWWYDKNNDIHYRNGNITLEFMVDDSLKTSDCIAIKFVDHHKNMCCIDAQKCPDKGLYSSEAGARFLAGCLERYIPLPHRAIISDEGQVANTDIDGALHWLCQLFKEALKDEEYLCKMAADDPNTIEIVRIMLSCLANENRYNAGLNLAKLFGNKEELEKIVFTLAEEYFDIKFKERRRRRRLG